MHVLPGHYLIATVEVAAFWILLAARIASSNAQSRFYYVAKDYGPVSPRHRHSLSLR